MRIGHIPRKYSVLFDTYQHRVFIDNESFDPVKLLDAAGIESYPQLPEMIYAAKRS